MVIRTASLVVVLALLVACSKEGNPVALPSDPGGPSSALQLSVQTDSSALVAGSTTPARLTIVATQGNGAPAADGTSITLNTTLGAFAFDPQGKPVQVAKLTLAAGRATTQFFAGSTAGTATIMATAGTVVATLNLPITIAPPAPVANFEYVTDRLTAIFTDLTTGAPDAYHWDFGDGETSSLRNPSHTYAAASTYQVTLTVSNTAGSSSKSQFVPASLGNPPMAAFEFAVEGQRVNFVDMSAGATSWSWSFGDGKTSSLRNPIHVYAAPGTFTVTLAAANAAGTSTASKVVAIERGVPPKAAFTATPSAGRQVNFIDQSTGSPASWQWTFGDGNTSSVQNPIHTYAVAGVYTVTLTVSNAWGPDSISQVVTVAAGAPPVSAFTFAPDKLRVNFADASTGNPTSWSWSFGDGTSSTQQNPVHVYPAYGNYTVMLTVTNASGSNTSTQIVTLAAPPAPVAAFTATVNAAAKQVNFVDASTGSPTSWLWSFGDATASTQQNPIHVYPAAGTYTVTLTAANASGSSKATQVVTIPAE